MSVEANKALLRRLYDEVINEGNIDLTDEFFSDDFVEHEVFPGLPTGGPEAAKAAFAMFLAAFPDLRITPEDMIAEGDKVAVRATISGTHRGEFLGIPPTNKSFEAELVDIIEIHDGKATAHWGLTDQGAIMEQLGVAVEA